MRKKVLGFVFAAAVLIAMSAPLFGGGTAQASVIRLGACPDGFTEVGGFFGSILDRNGDGILCQSPFRFTTLDRAALTDNNLADCDTSVCEDH